MGDLERGARGMLTVLLREDAKMAAVEFNECWCDHDVGAQQAQRCFNKTAEMFGLSFIGQ